MRCPNCDHAHTRKHSAGKDTLYECPNCQEAWLEEGTPRRRYDYEEGRSRLKSRH